MAIKIFLDTNIVLDLLDDKRPFHLSAVNVYRQIEEGETEAFISESVLTTADYIFQKIASKAKRTELFTELLEFLDVLPCSKDTCLKAVKVNYPDLEDVLLHAIALDHYIDYFISNDKSLKKLSSEKLPVLSSKEFLSINR